MKEFISQKNGKLTQILLKEGLNFSVIKKLYRKKDIKVNGVRVSKEVEICSGDKITLYLLEEKPQLNVLFNDQNVLVVNKPQGIESKDFYEQVKTCYPSALFVHRLDRNTGGLIIFALNEQSYDSLYNAIKNREIEKYYVALLYGNLKKPQDTLTAYAVKDSKSSFVSVYDEFAVGRKKMVTEYKTLKQGQNCSAVEVKLVTGRTHQIRCHFAHIGNFVIGDGKYGKESVNKLFKFKFQQLYAYKLTFNFKKGDFLYYLNGKQISLLVDFDKWDKFLN